jgi:hypothetical protein
MWDGNNYRHRGLPIPRCDPNLYVLRRKDFPELDMPELAEITHDESHEWPE